MDRGTWRTLIHRSPNTNKYDYGHILIVGGSESMAGAAILAARAALRIGSGLVTIASSSYAVDLINRDVEEIMTLALPAWNKPGQCLKAVRQFIENHHVTVLALGPGLPPEADKAIRSLFSLTLPTVADAETFTALSGHLNILKHATATNKEIVLTPHPGEYKRLTRGNEQYRGTDELSLKRFVRDFHVTLVFKQAHTLVINNQGDVYKNTTGNAGLATAGSGDALTGITAGLMAQKISPYQAARMAVYLHGLAADIAIKLTTEPGMIASDIIENIPAALKLIDSSASSIQK